MYQYKTEERTSIYLWYELEQFEKEGWELVSHETKTEGFLFTTEKHTYRFRRPHDWFARESERLKKERTAVLKEENNFRSDQARFWAALSFYRPDLFEKALQEDKFDDALWLVFKKTFQRDIEQHEKKYKVLLPLIIQKLIKDAAIINPEIRDKNNESDK